MDDFNLAGRGGARSKQQQRRDRLRQQQLTEEKEATQQFVGNLIAHARSHRRFKPIDVLGQVLIFYMHIYSSFSMLFDYVVHVNTCSAGKFSFAF